MAIKHSIFMICYNQEQYIRSALDSVLCEQVKPYEIIIGDDCSTDGTRAILEEYRSKYPGIIKLVLNEKNLGIFANLNNVTPRVTGDVMHILAGDDWYKPHLLENFNRKIEELNIDPSTSRFILLPNVVHHHRNGSEVINRNSDKVLAKYTPVGSVLRGKLHTRHVGLSRALFEKWPLFSDDSEDIGPWADFVQYVMFSQHIESMIIMDCEGPVYRVGVGIASRTKSEELARSFHRALVLIQAHYLQGELKLNELDAKYLEFLIACGSVSLEFSVAGLARLFVAAWRVLKSDILEIGIVAKELMLTLRRAVSLRKSR